MPRTAPDDLGRDQSIGIGRLQIAASCYSRFHSVAAVVTHTGEVTPERGWGPPPTPIPSQATSDILAEAHRLPPKSGAVTSISIGSRDFGYSRMSRGTVGKGVVFFKEHAVLGRVNNYFNHSRIQPQVTMAEK